MTKPLNHQREYMALIAQQLAAERATNSVRVKTLRIVRGMKLVRT